MSGLPYPRQPCIIIGMAKAEFKVHLRDDRTGRKSFTLVNATDANTARKVAESHHAAGNRHGNRAKTVTSVEETGRRF
jgi:hypothetical protein